MVTTSAARKLRYTIATERPRGTPGPPEQPHDGVEQQRHQRGDEEDEDDVSRRRRQHPRQHRQSGRPTSCTQRGICTLSAPARSYELIVAPLAGRFSGPGWDWTFMEDGALALDRHELWEEPAFPA